MTRVPSLKALKEAFPQSDPAELERFRLLAKTDRPRAALHKADSAIEGYGACGFTCPTRGVLAYYVNTGDSYSLTLLCNLKTGAWSITTWGDYVESFEGRHGRKAAESLSCY